MKALYIMVILCLLLTGCTDIRTRLSPDVLAVETGTSCRIAAHTTQENAIITANTASPLLFPDALQNASGAEISSGHLSLLAVTGNPCTLISDFLQTGLLAPTCLVLSVPEHACTALMQQNLPEAGLLHAAADTGQIPVRTADVIAGDLWCGSGITAIPVRNGDSFSLSLWDSEQYYGTLSASACRGLALLGNRCRQFRFAAEQQVYTVTSRKLHLSVSGTAEHLCFTVSGKIAVTPADSRAETLLTDMLQNAFSETAGECGADLLFLRETAVRDGIQETAVCTQEEWREMLKTAAYQIQFSA